MENRVQLIERVMRKVRLPTATLESVLLLSRIRIVEIPPEFSCKPVYLKLQIKELLNPAPPETDVRPPVDNQSNRSDFSEQLVRTVSTVSDEPSVDDLIARLLDITPRYELQGEIARGAMGRILAGWDLHLAPLSQ